MIQVGQALIENSLTGRLRTKVDHNKGFTINVKC